VKQDFTGAPGAAPEEVVAWRQQPAIRPFETDLVVEQATGFLDAVAIAVKALRVGQDALGIHPDNMEGNGRVDPFVGDFDFAHLGGPVAAFMQDDLAFLAGNRRANGAVVQGGQTAGGERPYASR
jgi:hypothetical protein